MRRLSGWRTPFSVSRSWKGVSQNMHYPSNLKDMTGSTPKYLDRRSIYIERSKPSHAMWWRNQTKRCRCWLLEDWRPLILNDLKAHARDHKPYEKLGIKSGQNLNFHPNFFFPFLHQKVTEPATTVVLTLHSDALPWAFTGSVALESNICLVGSFSFVSRVLFSEGDEGGMSIILGYKSFSKTKCRAA